MISENLRQHAGALVSPSRAREYALAAEAAGEEPQQSAAPAAAAEIAEGTPVVMGTRLTPVTGYVRRSHVEDELWSALAPPDDESSPQTEVSANLQALLHERQVGAQTAVATMAEEEACAIADVFGSLVAHGQGEAPLDLSTFQALMTKLKNDDKGAKLLALLLSNRMLRRHQHSSAAAS